jgi:Recombinase
VGVPTIRHVLSNELCIGQMTYNVMTKTLQGRTLKNPEQLWTRFSAFEPIVPVTQFRKAQERLSRSANRRWDKEAITDSLQSLFAQKGRLSQALLNDMEGAPSAETVVNHFGSLHAAYAAVGYKPPARPPFGIEREVLEQEGSLDGTAEALHRSRTHFEPSYR